MKKLLLLLLLSLGLIGSSWSLSLAPTDEQLVDRINYQIAYIRAVIELSSKKYEMQVNELIEKRKLLNPESNQEEIDEIIKLSDAARKRCFDAFRNYWNEYEILGNAMRAINYRPYDRAISEAKYKLEAVNYRCSLSMDESCEKDIEEADSNLEQAKKKLNMFESILEERVSPFDYSKDFCPNWNSINNESIDKINDSDS